MYSKRKRLISIFLVIAVAVSFGSFSYADTEDDIKKDQKKLEKVQKQQDDVSEELDEMAKRIEEKQQELDKLTADINAKQAQINRTEKELKKTKKDIKDRREGLNKRLRAMYKSGSIGYVDVILGSNSVEELVTNVDLVQKIFSNDQNILVELKAQKKEIEAKEKKLEEEKESLNIEKAQQDRVKEELDQEEMKLQTKLEKLKAQEEELKEKIRKAAAEMGEVVYEGGEWDFPLKSGYSLTSHFGEARSYEHHPGIDLAVPTGTPIYAAQSGKVVTAGWYGGYGNAVVIYHGNGLTSVYGHNSQVLVNSGDYVERGQLIAKAGSTGWSTGSHLHFEVRNASGSPISPGPYIGIS